MTATSSARLGRKINRPSGALRTPACASCERLPPKSHLRQCLLLTSPRLARVLLS